MKVTEEARGLGGIMHKTSKPVNLLKHQRSINFNYDNKDNYNHKRKRNNADVTHSLNTAPIMPISNPNFKQDMGKLEKVSKL